MKSQKMNRRALLIRFLICLAILAALGCAYWVNMRSGRIRNAKRIAQAIAEDVQDRMNGIRKYAGIAAAWLDASGDEAKKALSDPGKAEKYRDTFGKIASALYDPDDMDSILLIAGETVALGYPESDSSDLRGKTPAQIWGTEPEKPEEAGQMLIFGPSFVKGHGFLQGFCMPAAPEHGSSRAEICVVMSLPDALYPFALNRLTGQGYDFCLSYVDKQNGKKTRIAESKKGLRGLAEISFDADGTKWILGIRPASGWVSVGGILLTVLLVLAGALLLSWILEFRKENREDAMKKLRSDAKHDKMTGLLNHTSSEEAINESLKTEEGGVLLLIDVDNFKTVNDTAGHLAGDEVLVEVANAMRTTFRRFDILGRYGGDEFIVYMNGDISIPDFSVKASQFQRKIRKIPAGNTGQYVTCSIGGARRCVETPTAEDMIRRADQALYTSKGNGKDRFTIFDDSGSTLMKTPKRDGPEMSHDFTLNE